MLVPCGRSPFHAAGFGSLLRPASTFNSNASSELSERESSVMRATEPMDGKASPRKPSVEMLRRSTRPFSSESSLDVACRSTASVSSSASIPQPSSLTRKKVHPPSSASIVIWRAPASSAFSTSSLMAAAGRSTTSPAAIRFTASGGSKRIPPARFRRDCSGVWRDESSGIAASLKEIRPARYGQAVHC